MAVHIRVSNSSKNAKILGVVWQFQAILAKNENRNISEP